MKNRKRVLILTVFLALGMILGSSNYQFQIERIEAGTWVDIPFTLAESATQYIDATQTTTYGTVTNGPPNGMGNGAAGPADDTHLQEASYGVIDYTTLTFITGDVTGGWTSDTYSWTGSFHKHNGNIEGSYGTIASATVDASTYDAVRITFGWWTNGHLADGDAYVRSDDSGSMTTVWTSTGEPTSKQTVDVDRSGTVSLWDVQFKCGDLADLGTPQDSEESRFDDLYLKGKTDDTYYRMDFIFRFDSVDYGLDEYFLYVDFYTALTGSDDLDMFIETGDTTPDLYQVADNAQDDFFIDVTPYITGDTVYLSIFDDYRTGDTVQTTAYIERISLRTTSWNAIEAPSEFWFDLPEWIFFNSIGFVLPVGWDPQVQFGYDMFFIMLGLIMIPFSTLYLVRGGRKEMSRDKLFYGLIILIMGLGLVIGGVMP